MIDSASGRILAVWVLLCALAGLAVLHGTQPTNPDAGVYPDTEELVTDPDRYVGERVTAYGVVDADVDAEPGDRFRVYGVLEAPGRVRAIEAFTVPPRGLWYAIGISFLAGLWVLARLVAHWTVDPRRLALHPRERPLTAGRLLERARSRLEVE